jgi:hypothetical protein
MDGAITPLPHVPSCRWQGHAYLSDIKVFSNWRPKSEDIPGGQTSNTQQSYLSQAYSRLGCQESAQSL